MMILLCGIQNLTKKCGINVELNKTEGTIHGFEIAKESENVKEIVDKRIMVLKRAFNL